MAFSHRIIGGVNIVSIENSMDLYSVPELKKFCKILTRSENSKILFNLKKVHFIDSSGLGFLTNLFFECQQKGISIKFADLSDEVKRLFALTKLDLIFNLYDSEGSAIQDFN